MLFNDFGSAHPAFPSIENQSEVSTMLHNVQLRQQAIINETYLAEQKRLKIFRLRCDQREQLRCEVVRKLAARSLNASLQSPVDEADWK